MLFYILQVGGQEIVFCIIYFPKWHNHILSICTENKETIVLSEKQKEKKIPLDIVINKKYLTYSDKKMIVNETQNFYNLKQCETDMAKKPLCN